MSPKGISPTKSGDAGRDAARGSGRYERFGSVIAGAQVMPDRMFQFAPAAVAVTCGEDARIEQTIAYHMMEAVSPFAPEAAIEGARRVIWADDGVKQATQRDLEQARLIARRRGSRNTLRKCSQHLRPIALSVGFWFNRSVWIAAHGKVPRRDCMIAG